MSGWQTVQLQEETSEQRQKRLHKSHAMRKTLRLQEETPEQRQRLHDMSMRETLQLQKETPEQRQRRLYNMSMHETLRLQETPEQRQRRLQDKSHCVRLYDYRRRHQSRNRRGCSVCHHGRMLDYQHKLNRSDKTGKGMNQLARGNYIAN